MSNLPPFHPMTVIASLPGQEWYFTIDDAMTGVCVWGATGSGKTSGTGEHLALGYLNAEMGGIVLCAKKTEVAQWKKWAAYTAREEDLIVVDASAKHSFNFMEWEAARGGEGGGLTINIVALLEEIISGLQAPGKGGSSEEGGFWEDALHQLLTNAVELVLLAGYEVDLATLRDVVRSAPTSRAQAREKEWQGDSVCWRFLGEAEAASKARGREVEADYAECRAYWLDDYANLSEKTRSIITLMFTKLAQPFAARPLRALFSGKTTVTPEAIFAGKVLVIDLATQEFRLAGRICALVWKYCTQISIMRRPPAAPGTYLRPVFIWADEAAENFLSKGDSEFQAVARANAGCTVYLAQNINQYKKRLGDADAFESFISNLQTKFFHQNTGPSCRWGSELLGETWELSTTISTGRSGSHGSESGPTPSSGVSQQQQKRYQVEPGEFTTLKRGGFAYGLQVEAIVYKGGHIFPDGRPFKKLTFQQK